MEHWILKMKVHWGGKIDLEMETMWHFLCSCFAVSNGGKFKSIYLKFHPFQLPPEHLQHLQHIHNSNINVHLCCLLSSTTKDLASPGEAFESKVIWSSSSSK